MSAAVLATSSGAALTRLDGYMAAAGYDTEHPWRAEIAATFNAPAGQAANGEVAVGKPPLVSTGVHCMVHIQDCEVDDRINLLTAQLAAILRVMPSDGYDPHIAHIIQMLAKMAAELAEKVRDGVDGSVLVTDIRELLYMIQDEKRTDHVHWLCQQIVDELDFIFTAKQDGENPHISAPN